MVIISNLIQVQKPVRRIDDDDPRPQIDPAAYLPAEGNEDLSPGLRPDDQEIAPPRRQDVRHRADIPAGLGHDPAPQKLIVIERVLGQGREVFLGNEQLGPGQGPGPADVVDSPQLEEIEFLEGPQGLDLVPDGVALSLQKYPGKKKAFRGTADRARS